MIFVFYKKTQWWGDVYFSGDSSNSRSVGIFMNSKGILFIEHILNYQSNVLLGQECIDYNTYERMVGHQLMIASYKNKQMMHAFQQFDKDGNGFITGSYNPFVYI